MSLQRRVSHLLEANYTSLAKSTYVKWTHNGDVLIDRLGHNTKLSFPYSSSLSLSSSLFSWSPTSLSSHLHCHHHVLFLFPIIHFLVVTAATHFSVLLVSVFPSVFPYPLIALNSSRYSDWLRAGRSGIESRWGRDFPPVQTGPGAHPASCKMGTGSFPGVKCGRGVLLTTHPLLVPRSWKSRAIPLPTLWATPGL